MSRRIETTIFRYRNIYCNHYRNIENCISHFWKDKSYKVKTGALLFVSSKEVDNLYVRIPFKSKRECLTPTFHRSMVAQHETKEAMITGESCQNAWKIGSSGAVDTEAVFLLFGRYKNDQDKALRSSYYSNSNEQLK